MGSLSIEITKGISKHFKKVEHAFEAATVTALNRSGKSAFGAVIKFLSKNYNISQKDLKAYFSFRQATKSKQIFEIRALRTSLGFYVNHGSKRLFNVKQLKKGVKYAVRKGKNNLIEGAFIAQMSSGHKGAFKRIEGQQSKTRKGNLTKHSQAIKELYAINIGGVFFGKMTREELENKFYERFEKEFEHNLKRNMDRLKQ